MADTPTPPAEKSTPTRPPRRWLRRLVGFLLLLLALVFLAPNIIAWTGLTETIARQALGDLNGKLRIDSSSLGWFSPIELREVSLLDKEGATVVSVPRVTSSRTLFGLAWDRADLGEFRLERPTLNLVLDRQSSNLERVIAPLLKPSTGPAGPSPAVSIQVQDATVHLRDAASQRTTTLEQGQVTFALPASGPARASLNATVADGSAGKISVEASLAGNGRVRLVTEGFPLESVAPFLQRHEPSTRIAGRLSGETTITWGTEKETPTLTMAGNLRGQDLVISTPSLRGDTLKLARLELPHDLARVGSRTTVHQWELRCDVGWLSLRGAVDSDAPVDRWLNRSGVSLDAEVDLAHLARLLPQTLTVREGTTVQEGKVIVRLSSQDQAPATLWKGEVRTSALRAERQGRPLRWDEPLVLSITSRVRPGELPTVDQFECRSDFLSATASGTAESLQLRATLSLDQLVQKLADFIDLGGVALAGRGDVELKASRTPAGALQARAVVQAQQFAYTDRAGRSVREPSLTATLDAGGLLVVGQPVRIDTGSLSISAGTDLLSINLRSPMPDLAQVERASAHLSLTGDLARWRMRADGLVALPQTMKLAGNGTITALATYHTREALRLDKVGIDVEMASFHGYGIALDEPKLVASAASVVMQPASGRVEVTNLLLSSSTVALNVPQVTLEPVTAGYQVIANGTVQADLARLQRTLQLQTDPRSADAWAGRAGGSFRCTADGTTTQFGGDLDLQNFAYGPPHAPTWKEPQLKVTVAGTVDPVREKVRIESARLGRDALTVEARGSLSRWSTTSEIALAGSLTYDLARLTPQFRDVLGAGVQATGQGRRDFTLTGTLTSLRTLNASASVGWQSVRAYGLDVGPGELKVNLANGILTSNPLEATFLGGSGKVRVQPTVRLDPLPQEATLANGTLIDRARLTPASTSQALGYALPVIANSNATEGEFSFHLDSNRIPLAAPMQTNLRGRLVIHRAVVSASPLIAEIARLLKANQTSVVLANENIVPVRVEEGRVHHENLTLSVNNFTIKTRGSVGFDSSLSLVAEIPAPAGLLNNTNPKVAQALAGRTIAVPIAGTLQRPMLDAGAFQQAVARLAAEVVQDTLRETGRDLINKELNKVLPGGKDKDAPKIPGLDKLIPGFPKR